MGYVCQKTPGGETRYFESCLQWMYISLSLFVHIYKASLCIAEKLIVVPIFILFSWCIQIWRMDAEYLEQTSWLLSLGTWVLLLIVSSSSAHFTIFNLWQNCVLFLLCQQSFPYYLLFFMDIFQSHIKFYTHSLFYFLNVCPSFPVSFQAVEEFLSEVRSREQPHSAGLVSQPTAVKFLMARKFDVSRAIDLFQAYKVWHCFN